MAFIHEDEHAEIRRQVEHYFSDYNLGRPDHFLRDKMKRKNHPVPLKTICGFKMMREFTLESVKAALQDNPLLNLVDLEGTLCIQRKTPFVWPEKKPKVKPTGFENYFTDKPITVEESIEEQDLYSKNYPFAQRIETALQRFQARRRFDSHRRDIFEKWLRYGGVDTGPKPFGGVDQADLEDKTKEEIRALTATTFVGDEKFYEGDDALWFVEFETVAKAFLSSMVPYYWSFESPKENSNCVATLRNFYNYVLLHDVCPEFVQDILAARRVCDVADEELPATQVVMKLVPGDFNLACSALFGGFYTHSQAWPTAGQQETDGFSTAKARQVFAMGCAAYGLNDCGILDHAKAGTGAEHALKETEVDVGLTVTKIISADETVRHFYEVDIGSTIKPLGRLVCAPWTIPDFSEYDLPVGFKPRQRPASYEFFLEQDIIDSCFVGMKMEATIHTLDSGLQFLNHVTAVRCSFYTVLENEVLNTWKEPKWISREEHLARQTDGNVDEDGVGNEDGVELDD